MLIFQESGRLGNQIFQYTALRSLCKKDEKLLLLGFSDLKSTFDGIDAQTLTTANAIVWRAIYSKFYNCLHQLSKNGLICQISEKDQLGQYELIQKKGFINSIKFVEEAYFQNESLIHQEVVKKLVFKRHLLANTKHFLDTISSSNTNFFIHIRREDYLSWPSKDNPAVLPTSYYKKCIDIICSKISDPFFIFTSDDPIYVADIFSDRINSYISRNSSIDDFALMCHCQGGILSASSFSWWAAYFSHLNYPNGIFLAPEYWAGHSLNSWFPPNIKSEFLSYIEKLKIKSFN